MTEYRAYEEDSAPLDPASPFFLDHVSRYWWAAEQSSGKDVLDCACGKGYGSYIVASKAKTALGIDLNERSLELARRTFERPNLGYRSQDIFALAELGRSFDIVIAFEVIEHIDPKDTDRFLSGIRKVLRPGGALLLSTPNHDVVTKSGSFVPDFHINNFTPSELRKALLRTFDEVTMLGQFRARRGLARIAFDLDFWNLRHVLRPKGRILSDTDSATTASLPSARTSNNAGLFESPYPGVSKYRFSPRHWRQAGLTVAVCR